MHIVDTVYFWARTSPLRPAIIEPAGIITYAALAHATEAAAEHFVRSMVDKSKPVAVWLPTGSKMLAAVFGLLRGGFNVVLAYKAVFEHLPSTCANTLVCELNGEKLDWGSNIVFDDSWIKYGSDAAKNGKPIPQPRAKGGDIVCFTSGTTGRPKTVVCSQRSWEARVLRPHYYHPERILIMPGLATAWGFGSAYETLRAGKAVCFAPTGPSMLWLVNTYGVDAVMASTQQALQLAELQQHVTRYPLTSLNALQIGAAAISCDGIQRLQKSLCRNVIRSYGSAEAGVVAVAPNDMIADVPSAVGYVLPGVEVEIVDAADRALPAGSEGLVRIRSPVLRENVVGGMARPAWFYPGDLGRLTEDGILCIAGRTNDVINRGGDKLSIGDLENFLLSCPGIKDAGVCSFMGGSGFEETWVGLVLDPAADLAVLRQAVESHATFGKMLDKLFVVESIPRGELGKIRREELKNMLHAVADADAAEAAAPMSVPTEFG
jgi:acyl-coenzyme A synthetase/AMP-(fatty) acid ligase